jgi:hypothetical protein
MIKTKLRTKKREPLLEQCCEAFKFLYIINYSLCKIADLAEKKSLKNKY